MLAAPYSPPPRACGHRLFAEQSDDMWGSLGSDRICGGRSASGNRARLGQVGRRCGARVGLTTVPPVNRREQIRMSHEEVDAFLASQRIIICATIGRDGFPHLMPLWYVVRAGELWAWTFAKSQKVRNLQRDARATLQIETGDEYSELRGVMLKTDVTIHRDTDRVRELGLEVFAHHQGELTEQLREMVRAQAPKRVALQFSERSRASWDHRKLAQAVR